jgi:hypothetical protein
VIQFAHDLQFSVLKPFVLQYSFDGHDLIVFDKSSLIDDSERTASDGSTFDVTDLATRLIFGTGSGHDSDSYQVFACANEKMKRQD